ncbi:MAG: 50S ribosomal protein L32 [Bacillota bacterium]
MAVPKRKTSKARRDSRRSANWKLSIPGIVECSQCHQPKLAHRVCKKCGYYDGRVAISVEKDGNAKAKA